MDFHTLLELIVVKPSILDLWLVVETMFVPMTPWLGISFVDEIPDVVIGPISQHLQEVEFTLSLFVSLD